MDVKQIQQVLNSHGFPCGGADGVLGPITKAAVVRFQEAFSGSPGWLVPDGIPGPQTQAALQWTQDQNALVPYFSIDEVRCHGNHCCGGAAYVKRELLAALLKLRQSVGPVNVVDCFRCAIHNAQVGGAPNSQHVQGLAADPTNVSIAQVLPVRAFTWIGTPDHVRAVHVDVRPGDPNHPGIGADVPH